MSSHRRLSLDELLGAAAALGRRLTVDELAALRLVGGHAPACFVPSAEGERMLAAAVADLVALGLVERSVAGLSATAAGLAVLAGLDGK